MTYIRNIRDLHRDLFEQLERLSANNREYDNGRKSAAKDLAAIVRLLLRDTRKSVSLLKQLGKKDSIVYYATPRLPGLTGMSHLTWILPYRNGKFDWQPFLGNFGTTASIPTPTGKGASSIKILGFYVSTSIEEAQEEAQDPSLTDLLKKNFEEWSNEIILDNGQGVTLTRKALIDSIADQDGGVHVDRGIDDPAYLAFSRQNAFGWTWSHGAPEHGPEYACMRQIAYELEQGLIDQLDVLLSDAPVVEFASMLIHRGMGYYAQGKSNEAIADFTRALALCLPDLPCEHVATALIHRGIGYGRQGRIDEAIADFTCALQLPGLAAEHHATALTYRGMGYYAQGKSDEAIAEFTRALAPNLPGGPVEHVETALTYRGMSYVRQGRHDEAIADFTHALAQPGLPAEYVATLLIHRGMGYGRQGRIEEAIADFSRAIDWPKAPLRYVAMALTKRAFAYRKQGKSNEEIADYERVINTPGLQAEQVAKVLFNRGYTYLTQGKRDEAIIDFTRTVDIAGAPPEQVAKALFYRGLTHGQQGRLNEEITDHTRIIALPGASAEQIRMAQDRLKQIAG